MDKPTKITVREDETGTTVVGTGSLDLYISDEFKAALKQACERDVGLIVDLRDAFYIDTAIIADLAGAGKRMRDRGKTLRVIVSKGSHPLRTLTITGLTALMELVEEPAGG